MGTTGNVSSTLQTHTLTRPFPLSLPPFSPCTQVVEMAPAQGLSKKTREAMFADSLRLTGAAKYLCAGTVEFLVDKKGRHFFIEVNPRVQVCRRILWSLPPSLPPSLHPLPLPPPLTCWAFCFVFDCPCFLPFSLPSSPSCFLCCLCYSSCTSPPSPPPLCSPRSSHTHFSHDQVEHTVTEEVTGIDIVQSQIRLAGGSSLEDLGLTQEKIKTSGYAMQCRVTTEVRYSPLSPSLPPSRPAKSLRLIPSQVPSHPLPPSPTPSLPPSLPHSFPSFLSQDPSRDFQPDSGCIDVFRVPGGMGVRIDDGPGEYLYLYMYIYIL